MNVKHLMIILAVLAVVVGCSYTPPAKDAPADTAQDTTANEVAEEPVAVPEEPVETTPPTPPEVAPPEAEEGDDMAGEEEQPAETVVSGPGLEIEIMGGVFEPADPTVKVGTTVTFRAVQGRHLLTINGMQSGSLGRIQLEQDGTDSIVLEKAEQVKVFDVFTSKSTMITVEEDSAAEEAVDEEVPPEE